MREDVVHQACSLSGWGIFYAEAFVSLSFPRQDWTLAVPRCSHQCCPTTSQWVVVYWTLQGLLSWEVSLVWESPLQHRNYLIQTRVQEERQSSLSITSSSGAAWWPGSYGPHALPLFWGWNVEWRGDILKLVSWGQGCGASPALAGSYHF